MREFTPAMDAYLLKRTNIEPIIIIGINWSDDESEVFYADKDIENVQGKILNVSNLDNVLSSKTGQSSSISVQLDDTDASIKGFLDQYDIYGVRATVYQTFEGLTLDDKFTLFDGKITFDVQWSEGERTVDLTIISEIEDREVGFSPEEGQFDFVTSDSVGNAWPLCFGSPIHVPAVKIKQAARCTLNDKLCIVDPVLYYKRWILTEAFYANLSLFNYYRIMSANGNNLQSTADTVLWDYLHWAKAMQTWSTNFDKTIIKIANAKTNNTRRQHRKKLRNLINNVPELPVWENDPKKDIFDLLKEDIKLRNDAHGRALRMVYELSKLYSKILKIQLEICKQEECVDLDGLYVKDSDVFPQDTVLDVLINNMLFRGTFHEGRFINYTQLPRYTNIPLATRQPLPECIDMDIVPYATFWVPDLTYQLKGMYILVKSLETGYNHILKVEEQVGTRCTVALVRNTGKTQSSEINAMIKGQRYNSLVGGSANNNPYPVLNSFVPQTLTPNLSPTMDLMNNLIGWGQDTFWGSTGQGSDVWDYIKSNNLQPNAIDIERLNKLIALRGKQNALRIVSIADINPADAFTITVFDFDKVLEVAPVVLRHWLNSAILPDEIPQSAAWGAEQGADIIDAVESCEIHVANILESEVLNVSAYRVNDDGVRIITTVPSVYFTTQTEELDTTSDDPFQLCTVRVKVPLRFLNERWEDQIYVTLRSTVGPNVVDIIQHLIETYTDKGVDTISFNKVRDSFEDNYPANFALLEQKNVFEQINDIAYQARCVAYVKENVYYLEYLSEKPSPSTTIAMSSVEQGSMLIGYSDLTDITTRLTALWKPDYLEDTEDNKLTLRHNIKKYGVHKNEIDFYIYNIESLVLKSATYWLIQNCNSWKYISITVPVDKLNLELFDAVNISLPGLVDTGETLQGIIEAFDYDSSNNNIKITLRLPVRSGEMEMYKFAWPALADASFEFPENLDITDGYVGSGNPIISGTLEDC